MNRVTIGITQDDRNSNVSGRDIPEESLMLTGDENIVDIDFSVFWVINNASDYLFNMEDPDGTVKAVAESAMREVVGRSNIQALLTQARQITETDVQKLIQQTLDEFGAGIHITQVQLLKVDPPAEVIASFRDVQAARADQERLQNEAQTYANKVVPEARGQASQITNAASAYRDRMIAEATGQGAALRPGLRELQGRRPTSPAGACIWRRWSRSSAAWTRSSSTRRATATASCPTCRSTPCGKPSPSAAGSRLSSGSSQ